MSENFSGRWKSTAFFKSGTIAKFAAVPAGAEGVEFFPIHITPTPFDGADWLTEMQLRPGKTESLFSYPLHEREAKMVAITEEIAAILKDMEKTGRRVAKDAHDKANIPKLIDITRLRETTGS